MSVEFLFFVAAAVFLLLAVHPFITYPLSLRAMTAFRKGSPKFDSGLANDRDGFSICVCAYNEGATIRQTIENLLEIRRRTGKVQILLYVDGATDSTAAIAREYAEHIDLLISNERCGKAHGLNRLVPLARERIVVFADANVTIDPDALVSLRRYFADPGVGCVCGHLSYVNPGDSTTAASGSLYWRLEEGIKRLESATGSVMGADGSLYAIRRQLYRPIPSGVADDMFISFAVLCDGYRMIRGEDVRVYERAGTASDEEFRRKIRIGCQAFSTHRVLWPELCRLDAFTLYKYVSHKLLRWFTVFSLAFAGLFGLAGITLATGPEIAGGIVMSGLAATWIGWRCGVRPLPMMIDALWSFVATGIGAWRALNGARVWTWEPARSGGAAGKTGQ